MATSAIRFYEEAGLLPEPERTASGYRPYDQSVIDRLSFIKAGQGVGLTLNELREVLTIRDRGCSEQIRQKVEARVSSTAGGA
jgi:DNA-binding transcriptional MerR regulator